MCFYDEPNGLGEPCIGGKCKKCVKYNNRNQVKKPIALDLCCGKGGWTKGLKTAGFTVWGFDIEKWGGYEGDRFFIMDVRELIKPKNLIPFLAMVRAMGYYIALIVASPPCQEFSYRSFPFKRCRELAANVPPDKTIWKACERMAKECGAPLVLENVRGAQKYMGKAVAHYGSYYLWGDVPALLPEGNPTKGFTRSKILGFKGDPKDGKQWRGNCPVKTPVAGNIDKLISKNCLQRVGNRKEFAAKCAMIPFELAYWIGKCFYPQEVKNESR